MDVVPSRLAAIGTSDLIANLLDRIPQWQSQAQELDQSGAFPVAELDDLRRFGAFLAPLPKSLGGLGWGTESAGANGLLDLLRLIGRGNMSVGRVFEGHVNALKLIALYGSEVQLRLMAADAAAGHLFAVWNTESAEGLRLAPDGKLLGQKIFCSAAGHATRPLVTVRMPSGDVRMALLQLQALDRMSASNWKLLGMRACGTGSMVFDGMTLSAECFIGEVGDYLRQPEFSAGAWRTSAVTLGGLEALVREAQRQLVERRRDDNPHQRSRMGMALIALETAHLWVGKAAQLAEGKESDLEDVAGYVNLARIAVETACLGAMQAVQRTLGLAGLVQSNPVERMLRDLSTYLRQPAPDETLDEAAGHFTLRDLPVV